MSQSSRILAAGAAVSALGALWSSAAFALGPGVAIAQRVYISGASAQDNGFERLARSVCQNNVLTNANTRVDIYRGTDSRVFTCLSNANLVGVANGTAVAIYKSSVGGSGGGPTPLLRPNLPVNHLPVTLTTMANAGNCTITGGPLNDGNVPGETVGATTFAGYVNHTACGAPNNPQVPSFGVSDVEPALTDGVQDAEEGLLTTTAVNQGVFGIVVSQNLRNVLQAAQGLTAGSETYANVPSLTRPQIAAIFNGNINNWDQLTNNSGVGLAAFANADATLPNPVAAPEGGARTFIIRRVPSSGTQASTEIWSLDQRCVAGAAEFLGDSDPATDASGSIPTFNADNYVQAYSSSTGVRNGMDRAAGALSVQNPAAANNWAIGLLSTENNNTDSSNGNRAYRFIKIDGFAPTLLDTVNGGYNFYAEQVVVAGTGAANPANGGLNTANPPAAGLPDAFYDYALANLSNVDVLQSLNSAFRYPWGDAGLLGVPDPVTPRLPPNTLSQATVRDEPINSSWKSPLGSTNNCQDPVILGVAGIEVPAGGRNANTALQGN